MQYMIIIIFGYMKNLSKAENKTKNNNIKQNKDHQLKTKQNQPTPTGTYPQPNY